MARWHWPLRNIFQRKETTMQSNGQSGNGQQPGEAFDLTYAHLMQGLQAEGLNPDLLQGLREKVSAISGLLQTFRAKRREAGDSGKYSRDGLLQVEAELASRIAGEIRRVADVSHLANNIRQHEEKLRPKPIGDATERLIATLRQQEIRFSIQGLIGNDALKANELYMTAMAEHNVEVMESLEGWPLRSPVSPELIVQGRAQRAAAVDPVAAKARDELVMLKRTLEAAARDAISELPLAQADQLQHMV
jgi:hypothetical protein